MYLCQDTLHHIFSYLSARDLLSCSFVCKDWNKATNDNYLWFMGFTRDLPKYVRANHLLRKDKKDPRFIYFEDISYKMLYLSCFQHKYEFEMLKHYKELCCISLGLDFWLERICISVAFVIGGIVLFPVILGFEIYEYCHMKTNKNKFCDCEKCFHKMLKTIQ